MAEKKNLTLPERVAVLQNSIEFGETVADAYRNQLVQDQLKEIGYVLAELVKPPKAKASKPPAKPKKSGGGSKAPAAKEKANA